MKISSFKYSQFAFKTVFKKKSSIILPILTLIISFILGLIFKFAISEKYLFLSYYLYIFAILIETVLFASIKALNIFKDFEQEGLELLTLSKPISRNNVILGKLWTLIYFGLVWSIILFISSLFSTYALYSDSLLFLYSLLLFAVGFATYLLISLITALINYKFNQKISITLPMIFFIPLLLGGSLLSANATSNINNAAYYINKKYPYHFSGNEVNVEPFYLNNNKDELLLITNGLENKQFSDKQTSYLEEVMKIANKSSKEWQIYSWLSVPYQLLDVFNFQNKNVFESISKNNFSNLNNYIYYKDLDSILFKYKLDKNVNLQKYLTSSNIQKYIVPGLLKSHSQIQNTINTDIIYARQGADSINDVFSEDSSEFSSENNLVGKLKWEYVDEILKDQNFNKIAKKFIDNFTNNQQEHNLINLHKKLLNAISLYIQDEKSDVNQYLNPNLTLFNPFAIKEKKLQSEIERKIYFAVALLNFIYFNYQNTELYQATIKNINTVDTFGDSQIKLNLFDHTYLIGGYESYEKISLVKDKNVVIRYSLVNSDKNYLFVSDNQVFAINRDVQIVNKNVYALLWIMLIIILFNGVFILYKRKDYK
ncbi:ABC transporter permease [Mycoplasma miroungirhinis]|uniref:ABC transporter permease n=1 Tax=Mycoplasma miroungirhinis TaxID=754516 RepID=A0A6M4JD56_9MOLU|nr:ABC transporter permease [Mycoplasma miroungirhinis]QJR44198.1 ABC transporter permease [Mycoplasma miroungirhinis]